VAAPKKLTRRTQIFWMHQQLSDARAVGGWRSHVKAERAPLVVPPAAPGAAPTTSGVQVWAKELAGGECAVLFVNAGKRRVARFEVPNARLPPKVRAGAGVTDVWSGRKLPPLAPGAPLAFGGVDGHDSRFLLLAAV